MISAAVAVAGLALLCIILAWIYERHYTIERPPLGVFGPPDIIVLLGGVIAVPFVYLSLPIGLVVGLLGLGAFSILTFLLEPLVAWRWIAWLAALLLVGADVWTARGPLELRLAGNDAVLLLIVIGLANVWVQSGMRARDAAVFGAGLAVYDLIFTTLLPTTDDLFHRLDGFPLAPLIAWPTGDGEHWLGVGLGDLLLATASVLVMRKAFGRTPAVVALVVAMAAIVALLAVVITGLARGTIPVMVVLGPALVFQYLIWAWRSPERTTWQYLQAEPRGQTAR